MHKRIRKYDVLLKIDWTSRVSTIHKIIYYTLVDIIDWLDIAIRVIFHLFSGIHRKFRISYGTDRVNYPAQPLKHPSRGC